MVISELRDHTYFAKLRIRQDGEMLEIDSRPSDAIAVAVTCDPPLPIYVAEEVLDEVLERRCSTCDRLVLLRVFVLEMRESLSSSGKNFA